MDIVFTKKGQKIILEHIICGHFQEIVYLFSGNRDIQFKIWLHSANLPVQDLLINTQHDMVLTNNVLNLFLLKKSPKIFFGKTISCWVLIKRSLAGKLALCSQNFDWMHLSQEKAQKPLKFN